MNRSESFSQLDVHGISAHLSWATLNVMVDSVPDIHMLVSGSDDATSDLVCEEREVCSQRALQQGCVQVDRELLAVQVA